MKNYIKKLLLLSLALAIYTPCSFNMEAPKPAPVPGDKRTADEAFGDEETQIINDDDATEINPNGKITCPFGCKKQITVRALRQHKYNYHGNGAKNVTCPVCKAQIKHTKLSSHKKFHAEGVGVEIISCPMPSCNRKVKLKNLKLHLNIYHKNIDLKDIDLIVCDRPDCGIQIPRNNVPTHIYNCHGAGAEIIACDEPGCNQKIAQFQLLSHKHVSHKLETVNEEIQIINDADKTAMENPNAKRAKIVSCAVFNCNAKIAWENLKEHNNTFHKEDHEIVICDQPDCGIQIPRNNLPMHIYNCHGIGAEIITCDEPDCTQKIARFQLLTHKYLSHGLGQVYVNFHYQCNSCNEIANSLEKMRQHLKRVHVFSAPYAPHYKKIIVH